MFNYCPRTISIVYSTDTKEDETRKGEMQRTLLNPPLLSFSLLSSSYTTKVINLLFHPTTLITTSPASPELTTQ